MRISISSIFLFSALLVAEAAPRLQADEINVITTKIDVKPKYHQIGDMLLTSSMKDFLFGKSAVIPREKRQMMTSWPAWSPTFNYYFDSSLDASHVATSQAAISFWQNNTCINFQQSTTAPTVKFTTGGDGVCNAVIGMTGGVQNLVLGGGCDDTGVTVHEVGHALGFTHLMNRYDRDTFITVIPANVDPVSWQNGFYTKETNTTNNNYGIPYDYGSIMSYNEFAVSKNSSSLITMQATIPQYQRTMGSRLAAFNDVSEMNERYGCKQKCTSGATCVNGGYRHPRNCNTCICPSGYGGATCSDRLAGCGATLVATSTKQTQKVGPLGSSTMQMWFTSCNYLIQAPAGNKIEITINSLGSGTDAFCGSGCAFAHLEVKLINDHRYTGVRYCCPDDIGKVVVSEGNIVPIIINTKLGPGSYSFTYRTVPTSTTSTLLTSQIPLAAATYNPAVNPPTPPVVTPPTPTQACQQCAQNLPTFKGTVFSDKAPVGTMTYVYRFDPNLNNCLVADWYCQAAASSTTAKLDVWKSMGGGSFSGVYFYSQAGVNAIGYNDTTAQSYITVQCNAQGQWSWNGQTGFATYCYGDATTASPTTPKPITTPLPTTTTTKALTTAAPTTTKAPTTAAPTTDCACDNPPIQFSSPPNPIPSQTAGVGGCNAFDTYLGAYNPSAAPNTKDTNILYDQSGNVIFTNTFCNANYSSNFFLVNCNTTAAPGATNNYGYYYQGKRVAYWQMSFSTDTSCP